MGPQVLLIPALFVAICATFIILHSCYHKWKMSTILKRKRDAAKISLVNILQLTNPTLVTPPWSNANGAVKSNIRPKVLVNDVTLTEDKEKSVKGGLSSPTFDPRNPHVLSSVLIGPPPCYEDLYGPAGAVFTFKSLTPERDEPPPPMPSSQQNGGELVGNVEGAPNSDSSRAQYQYYSSNGNNACLLQVPPQDVPIPNQERRNSSAVLYL